MQLPNPCTFLTDSRWEVPEPELLRLVGPRKLKHPLRAIAEAIFFQLRTGCQWAELPRGRFPPAGTVYYHFRKWADAYVIDALNAILVKHLRAAPPAGDAPAADCEPTACVLDSQSVKSRVWGRRAERGSDGHKEVNGVKYHTATDTRGNVLACVVSAANVHDSQAMPELFDAVRQAGFGEVRMAYAQRRLRGLRARGGRARVHRGDRETLRLHGGEPAEGQSGRQGLRPAPEAVGHRADVLVADVVPAAVRELRPPHTGRRGVGIARITTPYIVEDVNSNALSVTDIPWG